VAESQVKHPALKGGASGLNGNCTMRQLTPTPMSDIASTSRSPSSRGPYTIGFEADVLRGVLVPVVDNAASKTCPFANGQRHLVAAAPATRARFGRRKKSLDSRKGCAARSALYWQKRVNIPHPASEMAFAKVGAFRRVDAESLYGCSSPARGIGQRGAAPFHATWSLSVFLKVYAACA